MTYFTLMKAFVCTAILILPKSFVNGGYAFSVGCMLGSAGFTLICAYKLIEVRRKLGGSASELALKTLGPKGKIISDITLALS